MKLLALSLLFVASTVTPQTRPDFSGVWVAVNPAFHELENLKVQQSAATLTETRSSSSGHRTITYRLDATGTSHGQGVVTLANAKWDGDSLVLTTITTLGVGHKLTVRQTWSLNAKMQLVAEIRRADSTGTTPPETINVVYEKR